MLQLRRNQEQITIRKSLLYSNDGHLSFYTVQVSKFVPAFRRATSIFRQAEFGWGGW